VLLFYQPFCENATPGKPVQLLNTRPQILSDLREETSFLEQIRSHWLWHKTCYSIDYEEKKLTICWSEIKR